MPDETYEDQFSRRGRWARRLWRRIACPLKGALGLRRHLLVELRWRLGDELMALPVLNALREKYPRDHISLWTNFAELMEKAAVADVYNETPSTVDRYINLRSAPRTVPRQQHYARLAGVKAVEEQATIDFGPPSERLVAMLPVSRGSLVALCPGASWAIKRWPVERWLELGNAIRAQGGSVVVLGLEGEDIPGLPSLCGLTTPLDAAQMLQLCDVVVACDSGLMHLALTAGRKTIGLFGPTDPAYLTTSPLLHPVRSGLPCSGFWNHAEQVGEPGVCPEGHGSCVAGINVVQVTRILDTY